MRAKYDFDGDGTSDILLYGAGNSTLVTWSMKDGLYSTGKLAAVLDFGYVPASLSFGEYTGDNTTDALYYHNYGLIFQDINFAFGLNGVFSSSYRAASGYLMSNRVVGSGDFDADRVEEALVVAQGQLESWSFAGKGHHQIGATGSILDTFFVGDFDGDGTADIATVSGYNVSLLTMKSGFVSSQTIIPRSQDGYTVIASGDFNGDGTTDLLLQNGETIVNWTMKNGAYQSGNVITTGLSGYTIKATGDYNGDGTTDILLQNGGTVVDWIMKDGHYQEGHVITTNLVGYDIVA